MEKGVKNNEIYYTNRRKPRNKKYAININNIACIETYVNDDGKLFTWIHGNGIDDGTVYVKETAEQILTALQREETIEQI